MLARAFRLFVLSSAFLLSVFLITAGRSQAQDSTAAAADEEKPYKIEKDGTVDWPTFSGFRRFNSNASSATVPTASAAPSRRLSSTR